MAISENIKELRRIYGITQKQLADIAGVTDKAVSTWEIGTNEPRMGAIQKIADYFGIQKSNIIENGGMSSVTKSAPELNLNPDAARKLESLIKIVNEMTEDEWDKLIDYAALILSAKQAHKED